MGTNSIAAKETAAERRKERADELFSVARDGASYETMMEWLMCSLIAAVEELSRAVGMTRRF